MKTVLFMFFCLCITFKTNAIYSNHLADSVSLKNEITFSQDWFGFYSYKLKYGRNIFSDVWLKTGLIVHGTQDIFEPTTSLAFKTQIMNWTHGITIGIEKQSSIFIEDLITVFGINSRFYYNRQRSKTENPRTPENLRTQISRDYLVGIGFSLGIYYNISEKFSIGSELNPYISYKFYDKNPNRTSNNRSVEYNILNNVSILCIKYQW